MSVQAALVVLAANRGVISTVAAPIHFYLAPTLAGRLNRPRFTVVLSKG